MAESSVIQESQINIVDTCNFVFIPKKKKSQTEVEQWDYYVTAVVPKSGYML